MIVRARYQPSGHSANDVATSVEAGLRHGELAPGELLPTVRSLATELGLSPATVAAAYRELRLRGVVVGNGRAGTRVALAPPIEGRLSLSPPAGTRDLMAGVPDPRLLPALPRVTPSRRLYTDSSVSPHLARVARARLGADGIDTAHLAVVAGALDGIERVAAAWLRPGDRVAVEDPGYSALLDLLAALRLRAVPLELDDYGVLPDRLEAVLSAGVDAAILTPRAQNPTGAAWDERRRGELAEVLAHHRNVLVVEDDHAGPVAGAPARTVCRDRARWATIRSVSKWLGPDLRLAVVAGDETTVARLRGRQALGTGWVSYLIQETVAKAWEDRAVAAQLRQATSVYRRRRRALVDALGAVGFHATGRSGLTTWIPLHDEVGAVAGLMRSGWAVMPGERYRLAAGAGIRVACATLTETESRRFSADLAACLNAPAARAD